MLVSRLLFFLSMFGILTTSEPLISSISEPFQQFCLQRTHQLTASKVYVGALVCGKKPKTKYFVYERLIQLGAAHAFVISGAHINLLKKIANRFLSQAMTLLTLSFYVLISGGSPPVLRAYFLTFLLTTSVNNLRPSILLRSIMWTMLLVGGGENHLWSLSLSWVAVSTLFFFKNSGFKYLWLYITLSPILAGIGLPHPFSILTNMILSPIVFFLLLPISFAIWLAPPIEPLFSPVWNLFNNCLTLFSQWLPPTTTWPSTLPSYFAFIYAALLQFCFWRYFQIQQRKLCAPA